MSTSAWNRRSSNTKNRVSVTQFLTDLGRQNKQSQSVERQSKIPLRASSQSGKDRASQGQNAQAQNKQRSKSQVQVCSSDTPLSHGNYTPSQCFGLKITPATSSNLSNKKMAFLKDTRKLQDKEFLKEASQLVQSYFQEKCPEVLINGVDMLPMTIKRFIAMVNHLFEVLGILNKGMEPVQFTASTYEKELPYWMKKLEYPGLITKAWLQTVNVPQYWPHVVGLLSWLVKLHSVTSMFDMEEQLSYHSDDIPKKWVVFFFKKSMEAFRCQNEGKEEKLKELHAEVLDKFRELQGIDEEDMKELQTEINELKEKVEDPNLMAEKDVFDEAEQHLRVLQSQQQKLINDIAHKEDDIEEMKSKITKKNRNCAFLKDEIEEAKKDIEKLKMTISMQSMSVADIADIEKKTDYIDKEINCLQKECEDYSELICKYELETAGMIDKILQSTHTFNRNIIQLEQLIPELKEFHIHMDLENEGIIQEMEKMVKSLETLKNKYIEQCQSLEDELEESQKNIAAKKQQLINMNNIIEKQKKKNEVKKKENDELSETFEKKEKSLKEESDRWSEKIKAIQEKLKEFDDLRDKKSKLETRHQNLNLSLQKTEIFWEEFWKNVADKWKHIPDSLELLLSAVNDQNKELEGLLPTKA